MGRGGARDQRSHRRANTASLKPQVITDPVSGTPMVLPIGRHVNVAREDDVVIEDVGEDVRIA